MNGFLGEGLLWTGTNLTIRNSQFRFNSLTALALFHNGPVPSSGVVVRGTDISDNGGDGIDMSSSYAVIEDNTISNNGWVGPATNYAWYPFEAFGIILNPAGNQLGGNQMDSVIVRNNLITQNGLSGITLISDPGDSFNRIKIDDNVITGHANGYTRNNTSGGWGVLFGKRYDSSGNPVGDVSVSSSFLRGNCSTGNHQNWNVPFSGVTAQNNVCPSLSVTIQGPTNVKPNAWCTWEAIPQGGTPPYSYEWGGDSYGGAGYEAMYSAAFDFTGWAVIWVTVSTSGGGWANEPYAVWVSDTAPDC